MTRDKTEVAPPVKEWRIPCRPEEREEFIFTFRSDGTGVCKDVGYETETTFAWDPEETLPSGKEGLDVEDELQEAANDLFWSEINPQLGEARVLCSDDFTGHTDDSEPEFVCGSREELENLSTLVLYSFAAIWADGSGKRTMAFNAESENTEGAAEFARDDYDLDLGSDLSEADRSRVFELLDFAVRQNKPVGDYLEYNDGDSNRISGYSWCIKQVRVAVDRPSFHETAEARAVLRERLKVFLSAADLARLLPNA